MRLPFLAVASAAALGLAAAPAQASDTLYGLTDADTLVSFASTAPGSPSDALAITGLGAGETLQGIDVRPATGDVYALATAAANLFVYRLDVVSGALSNKVTVELADSTDIIPAGTSFGADFNPMPDRLRVTSNTGQNLRINVDTGVTAVDTALSGTGVVGSAYTNSFRGTSATALYGIDATADKLVLQSPPNDGTLTDVGTGLGLDAGPVTGFDISPAQNTAYLATQIGGVGTTQLTPVDLTTGTAGTPVDTGLTLKGIAIARQAARIFTVDADGTTLRTLSQTPTGVTGTGSALPQLNSVTTAAVLRGIDVRPADGSLYGLTTADTIVRINPSSGATTLVSTLDTALTGAAFGVDFNPTIDRLRVVSDTNQSYAINVDTGAVTTQTALNPGDPAAVGAAYLTSFLGAASSTTTLFDVDTATTPDRLAIQAPPAAGTLTTVGTDLGVDADSDDLGFDIAAQDDAALLALTDTTNQLRRVLLPGTTGLTSAGSSLTVGVLPAATRGLAIDDSGLVGFGSTTFEVSEEAGTVSIPVLRTGGAGTATVVVTLGTATRAVTFEPGETLQQATFPVAGNTDDDGDRQVPASIARGAGGVRLGVTAATLTVTDDDPTTVPGPTTTETTTTTTPGETVTETTTTPGQTVTQTTPGQTTTTTTPGQTVTQTQTQTTTVPTTPTPMTTPNDTARPTLLIASKSRSIKLLRATGATYAFSCNEACTLDVSLLRGKTTIGRGTAKLTGPGVGRVTITLTAAGSRSLGRVRTSSVLTVVGRATDASGNVDIERDVIRARR